MNPPRPNFDSDTEALKVREAANSRSTAHNLEEWIFLQVQPRPGMRVLDLGCGTGKQIFALIDRILPGGSIVGLDVSDQAVAAVRERASREKREAVTAVPGSLETSVRQFQGSRFDLILSTYAIYYAKNMNELLSELKTLLVPGGKVFISGPGRGTNAELIDILRRISKDGEQGAEEVAVSSTGVVCRGVFVGFPLAALSRLPTGGSREIARGSLRRSRS